MIADQMTAMSFIERAMGQHEDLEMEARPRKQDEQKMTVVTAKYPWTGLSASTVLDLVTMSGLPNSAISFATSGVDFEFPNS